MLSSAQKRILLVRLDGVGDALALTPLVAALREARHTLGALLTTRNRDAFASNVFSHVHVVERIPWPRHGSTPVSYQRALADARACAYDIALIASEEPEAYRFAQRARIGQRIGFVNGREKPLKTVWAASTLTRWLVRSASAERQSEHEAETLFRLGRGLHGEAYPTRDADRLRPLLVQDLSGGNGRVVIQLTRKLQELGVELQVLRAALRAVAATYPSLGVADASEANDARALSAACGLDVEVTRSMSRWKELLAGARAVLTPDSGAAHVAGMAGVGCVDLFADGPFVAGALRRWYPWAVERSWAVAVTPRVRQRFGDHLLAGIEYVAGGDGAPAI